MALVTKGKFIGEWCDVIVWIGDELGIIVGNKRQFINIKFIKLSLDEVLDLRLDYYFPPYNTQYSVIDSGRGYKIVKL